MAFVSTAVPTAKPRLEVPYARLDTAHDVEIIEHSICSREMGTVLSMLWVPERAAPKLGMF